MLVDEARIHLLVGDHVHASHFQLLGQVGFERNQVLVRALHVACEFQKPAERAFSLVQRHMVAPFGRHARSLHAGRAASHHHHVLRVGGWFRIVEPRQLAGHDAEGVRGIRSAAEYLVAL